MGNLTSTSSTTTMGNWYGIPCSIHGSYAICNCNNSMLVYTIQCPHCQQWWNPNVTGSHFCSQIVPNTYTTGTTTILANWNSNSNFKDVKEITTDSELSYGWNGSSFDMKLPQQFNDCFLKVGYKYSPLYPLIFSAFENDNKTISFHLVLDITDKTFDGDKVVLKSVTTTKIEDNLTLLQLTERCRNFFKDKE
jgi:hypothetical protein